jgi:SAM-dependent methyltransferase
VKTTRRPKKATPVAGARKLRVARKGAKTLPLVTAGSTPPPARTKKKRDKKPKPPAKTMNAPEPVREVLVFGDLPDVRRALTAKRRRERSRGHLQPHVADTDEETGDDRQPLDATLIMNTLAVDVQPKIEDNYDYSVLDEFRDSPHCPRPTRMVNTGCGGGEAAVYFAKLGFNCVGIDPDRSDVGLARERAWLAGVDIDFMVGDLFETPNLLPAESFGLAVDRGAFFQIEDERERQRYLANIKRLMFKGGILLLSAGYFPFEDDAAPRKVRGRKGGKILLAREGGVVVHEMRSAGFDLLQRVLRPTTDSGELGELLLYLRK